MYTIATPRYISCNSAQELYTHVLEAIYDAEDVGSVCDPKSIGSAWGTRERPTRELRHVTLVLENPRNRLIHCPLFRLEEAIPRAVLCTLSDVTDLSTVSFYNPKAHEFSDDGKTVPSNYGHRIRNLGEVDQIESVVALLKQDPNSRRAVIHIHATGDSDLRYAPCVDSLHFLIRNGALECQSFWRSENALTLLPINLFEFTLLQELIASELNIPVGPYAHTVTSLHHYLEDTNRLQQTLEALGGNQIPDPMEPMTPHSLRQIEILRNFEEELRLQISNGSAEFSELSNYWQHIAGIMAYAIAKKRGIKPAMHFWKSASRWETLLTERVDQVVGGRPLPAFFQIPLRR